MTLAIPLDTGAGRLSPAPLEPDAPSPGAAGRARSVQSPPYTQPSGHFLDARGEAEACASPPRTTRFAPSESSLHAGATQDTSSPTTAWHRHGHLPRRRDCPPQVGHQLIGRALGGTVEVNPRGQQVGVLDLGWTEDAGRDALFGGSLPARAVQWNDDLVVTLPDGAVPLAQTAHGELQAARFADTVWGVQVHPEVDAVICRSWADGDRDHHREHGVDQDQLMVDITESEEELAASWEPVARRLVELVELVELDDR